MPTAWTCTALLHPFAPPASNNPPDNPFFQLCVANIVCMPGQFFSAQIAGCTSGTTWWYKVTPSGTQLSTDQGNSWSDVDVGWSVPSNWFGSQAASAACAGTSPLNWMATQNVDWWKMPVAVPGKAVPAATWMWFDSASQAPVRMMYKYGGSILSTMNNTNRHVKMYQSENLEFVVNQSIWFEGEAKFADVILPACTNFERTDISEWAGLGGYGHHGQQQLNHRVIIFQAPAIKPLGESRFGMRPNWR